MGLLDTGLLEGVFVYTHYSTMCIPACYCGIMCSHVHVRVYASCLNLKALTKDAIGAIHVRCVDLNPYFPC